jgi:hypothetical protein
MIHHYDIHGLTLETDFPLHEPDAPARPADLAVSSRPPRPIPVDPAAGELLALRRSGGTDYSVTRAAGVLIRFHGACDFQLTHELASCALTCAPSLSKEHAGLLLTGPVLSFLLVLRGQAVLHASAVAYANNVIAFAGPSGVGKSTLAALCCAAGARLVADDVLRTTFSGEDAWCYRGSARIRLRDGARSLADVLGPASPTVDGRSTVSPPRYGDSKSRLRAIVLPEVDRGARSPYVRRVTGAQGLADLLACQRVAGWNQPDIVRADFGRLAALAKRVPLLRARIPWPPQDPCLGEAVLSSVLEALEA